MRRIKKLTNKTLPVEIVPDVKYPEMYRLKWVDGVLSEDFYNMTRAHDMLLNYDLYRYNMKRPDPTWLTKHSFMSAE